MNLLETHTLGFLEHLLVAALLAFWPALPFSNKREIPIVKCSGGKLHSQRVRLSGALSIGRFLVSRRHVRGGRRAYGYSIAECGGVESDQNQNRCRIVNLSGGEMFNDAHRSLALGTFLKDLLVGRVGRRFRRSGQKATKLK